MTENDGNKFKELITAINVTYGEEFTQPQTLLWWNMFKRYSIEAFEQAVYQHMSDTDQGMFSPKPANIMKFITGTAKQNEQAIKDKSELAWACIEREISRIGGYGTLDIEDKQAMAAVKAIGGWKSLCMSTYDQLVWKKKEFMSTYETYERTPLHELPSKLPGLIELSKHKTEKSKDLKHIIDRVKSYCNNEGVDNG